MEDHPVDSIDHDSYACEEVKYDYTISSKKELGKNVVITPSKIKGCI